MVYPDIDKKGQVIKMSRGRALLTIGIGTIALFTIAGVIIFNSLTHPLANTENKSSETLLESKKIEFSHPGEESRIFSIMDSLDVWCGRMNRYPTQDEGLSVVKNYKDTWGNEYKYQIRTQPDRTTIIDVFTYGADSKKDGGGINEDIWVRKIGKNDGTGDCFIGDIYRWKDGK